MAEGSALKAMIAFFTIWRVDIDEDDMEAMNRKFHLVPLVGALIGIVVLVEALVLTWLQAHGIFGSSAFTAIAILATVFVGSRFLHFDGLTDFGDGSVAAGDQEKHVRALKDTLIGAGGLGVALIVTLMNFSLYSMVAILIVVLAPVTEILVKNAQVAAAAWGVAGHGMAGRQVSETTMKSLQYSTVFTLVLSLVIAFVGLLIVDTLIYNSDEFYGLDMVNPTSAFIAVLFGVLASILAGRFMAKRSNEVFGMVNGDILGATNEISRAIVMIVMIVIYNLVVRMVV